MLLEWAVSRGKVTTPRPARLADHGDQERLQNPTDAGYGMTIVNQMYKIGPGCRYYSMPSRLGKDGNPDRDDRDSEYNLLLSPSTDGHSGFISNKNKLGAVGNDI